MSFHIAGLGTALPEHRMSQSEAAELAQKVVCRTEVQSRFLDVLYSHAGVDHRYTALPHRMALDWIEDNGTASHSNPGGNGVASENGNGNGHVPSTGTLGPTTAERMEFYEQHAWPLAMQAAGRALEQAGIAPAEITHLITVSCTGFSAPGVDVELIRRLALRPTTERINVGFMGCHGAINGLRVAQAIAGADPQARILLVAVELCTLHYRFQWDPERCVGNALFSDGAAAVVGGNWTGGATALGPVETADDWQVAATGSCLLPDSTDAMTWRIGDHGFEMTLSRRVPELICAHLRPWLAQWLGQNGVRIDEVGSWAIHPGGPRILTAVEESLGLDPQATSLSRDVLARHGNMSSPTVLFILDRLRESAARRPCVMLGFGPGLMADGGCC